jgi:hypothetical protein
MSITGKSKDRDPKPEPQPDVDDDGGAKTNTRGDSNPDNVTDGDPDTAISTANPPPEDQIDPQVDDVVAEAAVGRIGPWNRPYRGPAPTHVDEPVTVVDEETGVTQTIPAEAWNEAVDDGTITEGQP